MERATAEDRERWEAMKLVDLERRVHRQNWKAYHLWPAWIIRGEMTETVERRQERNAKAG